MKLLHFLFTVAAKMSSKPTTTPPPTAKGGTPTPSRTNTPTPSPCPRKNKCPNNCVYGTTEITLNNTCKVCKCTPSPCEEIKVILICGLHWVMCV